MKFTMVHNNFNVFDLEKSISFYTEALYLKETKRIVPENGEFIIVFLGDDNGIHQLELTWLKERTIPYNLGDNEFHLAFISDDFEGALKKHRQMGCVRYENTEMGIYFIEDPDGYWLEIIPSK